MRGILRQAGIEVSGKEQSMSVRQTCKEIVKMIPPVLSFCLPLGCMTLGKLVTSNNVKVAWLSMHLDVKNSAIENWAPTDLLAVAKSLGEETHDATPSISRLTSMYVMPFGITPFTLK